MAMLSLQINGEEWQIPARKLEVVPSTERITVQMHPVCPFPMALLVLDCGTTDEDYAALALVDEMTAVVAEFSCCGGIAPCTPGCSHHAGLIASVKAQVGRCLAMSPALLYQDAA